MRDNILQYFFLWPWLTSLNFFPNPLFASFHLCVYVYNMYTCHCSCVYMCVNMCEGQRSVSLLSLSFTFWSKLLTWSDKLTIMSFKSFCLHCTTAMKTRTHPCTWVLFSLFYFMIRIQMHSKQWLNHLPNPFQREFVSFIMKILMKLWDRSLWYWLSHLTSSWVMNYL